MYKVYVGQDANVAKWVADHVEGMDDNYFGHHYATIAFIHEETGKTHAAVVYSNYTGGNVECSIAADTPRWATKTNIAIVCGWPFANWGVNRITAITRRKNKRVRRLIENVGFKLEGKMRRAFEDGADAYVYGLIQGEERFPLNG